MSPRIIEPHPDCPECKGSGHCQECGGSGQIEMELWQPPHALERWYDKVECGACDGDGECRRCEMEAADQEKYGAHL